MAAPLPTGAQLRVVPTAPSINARDFAVDWAGALASAQAGLALGKELTNLGNLRKQRELDKLKIEVATKQNKLEMMQLDTALETMSSPEFHQNLKDTLATRNQLAATEAANALTGARAAAPEAGLTPLQKTYATGMVNQGVAPGDAMSLAGATVSAPSTTPSEGEPAVPASATDRATQALLNTPTAKAARATKQYERDIALDTQVKGQQISTVSDMLKLYNVDIGQFNTPSGFDTDAARKTALRLMEENPLPALEGKPEAKAAYLKVRDAQTIGAAIDNLPELLKNAGDPNLWQRTLNKTRDVEGRGLIRQAFSALTASGVDPKVAQRQAVIDYINHKYSNFSGSKEPALKANDTDAVVLSTAKQLKSAINTDSEQARKGQPDWIFKSLEQEPVSVREANKAARAAVESAEPAVKAGAALTRVDPKVREAIEKGKPVIGADGKKYIIRMKPDGTFEKFLQE